MRSNRVLVITLALTAAVGVAQAQSPQPPQMQAPATTATLPQNAPVVLTVTGKLRGEAPVELTMAELRALPRAQIRTTTPWHNGEQVFEGVPLSALLEHLAPRGRCCRSPP